MPAILTAPPRIFRGRVLGDPGAMRQALESGAAEGVAEILVAVFAKPDTHPAVGNLRVQTIDQGAFRAYLESGPFPEPFFLDHGEAYRDGIHRSTHLAGSVHEGRETDEGLVIVTRYNLQKQIGRDAFSDLIHEPGVVQFSFGSDGEREEVAVRSGQEHVTEMWPVEYSQVAFGAQEDVKVIAARSAIASHSSETTDVAWSASTQQRGYEAPLARFYAWRDPDGDGDAKATYKFPHHMASGGAANLKACSAGIGALNGGRGGASIPDADRQGVWRHLAKHLRDGDQEPPELRAASPAADMASIVQRHAGAPAKGGRSLEALPREVREAWWADFELLSRSLGGPAIPEEVFGGEDDASGFLVVSVAGRFLRVGWERDDDEGILFDTRNTSELEVQWIEANGSRSRAADALRTHLPGLLVADRPFAEDVRRAVDAALEPAPAGNGAEDDGSLVRDLYRELGLGVSS
jgi:hypothetical protein